MYTTINYSCMYIKIVLNLHKTIYQKQLIEKRQTIQWSKENEQKEKQ